MSKKKVGVVCGGFSSEYEISIQSGKTVFSNLDRDLWETYLITIDSSDWTAIDDHNNKYIVSKGDFTLNDGQKNLELDVIFNAVHGAPGENGQLAALWELLEIPFSSTDSYNAALTFNKRDCLSVLRAWNVPTAKNFELNQGDPVDLEKIQKTVGLPCFVKANRAGSSFGVYKVNSVNELEGSIKEAFKEDHQLLIETALEGREVSVGVAKFNNTIEVFPITEIISENDFFDYAAKYEGKSQEITPAELPEHWQKAAENWSWLIYKKLGLKGVVRSEYIFVDGIPHLLEINTVPGMTAKSIIPQQLNAMGIELSDFFSYLLQTALK
ncbi:MAG: D-alanine--D-alanine ligase [Flavobacteriaceae bacterium]|nr:D-alanine--D-alanine ligase [Flavobacteriaceae bacterium]